MTDSTSPKAVWLLAASLPRRVSKNVVLGTLRGAAGLVAIGLLIGGCTAAAPTAAPAAAAVQPPISPPRPVVSTVAPVRPATPIPAPSPTPAGPTPTRTATDDPAEAAIRIVEKAFAGQDARDIIALLRNARAAGDDEQQFQAYLGAWQLMRLAYHQQGETADQKAALDAVEQIAARSSRYQKDLFRLNK